MLSDEEFNALSFEEIQDIQRLVGGEIIDVEPIEDGVLCGLILYLKRKDGSLEAMMLDAPGDLPGDTTFSMEIAKINTKEESNERT